MVEIKAFKTYQEQIDLLRYRGCVVDDESFAIDYLRRKNYYRFSGYLLSFKQTDGRYVYGTSFEKIAAIYDFDQKLRNIIIKALEDVEIHVKSIIAYRHGHSYGPLGYLEIINFNERHDHIRFIDKLNSSIENNKNALFVRHHRLKYGYFPIWVASELFTMGMISLFYADMRVVDKVTIAKEFNTSYPYLETWLHSSAVLRNICAHYDRLYNIQFHQNPKLPRSYTTYADMNKRSLFKQMYMLKLLYSDYRKPWNDSILLPLTALIETSDFIDLNTMGMPSNWESALRWE